MVIIIQGLLNRLRLSNLFIMRVNMMPRDQKGPKLLLDIGQDFVRTHFFKTTNYFRRKTSSGKETREELG